MRRRYGHLLRHAGRDAGDRHGELGRRRVECDRRWALEPDPNLHGRLVHDDSADARPDDIPDAGCPGRNDNLGDPDIQLVGGSECDNLLPGSERRSEERSRPAGLLGGGGRMRSRHRHLLGHTGGVTGNRNR